MKYKPGHLINIINAANDFIDVFKKIIQAYLTDETKDKLYDPLEINAWIDNLIQNPHRELTFDFINQYAMPLPLRPHATEFFSKFLRYKIASNKYLEIPKKKVFSEVASQVLFTALSDTIKKDVVLLQRIREAVKNKSSAEIEDIFVFVRLEFNNNLVSRIQQNLLIGNEAFFPLKAKNPVPKSSFNPSPGNQSSFHPIAKIKPHKPKPSLEIDCLTTSMQKLFTEKSPATGSQQYHIERKDTVDSETGEPIESIIMTPVKQYEPSQESPDQHTTTPKIY